MNEGGREERQREENIQVYKHQQLITKEEIRIETTEQGAGSDKVIPEQIKNNAGWWADGQIDDNRFDDGLLWLISNDVIPIPPTEHGPGSDNVIPGWIKNIAGLWSHGRIDASTQKEHTFDLQSP